MWAITLVCGGVHAVYNLWPFRASLPHVWGPLSECWSCGGERLHGEEGEHEGVGDKKDRSGRGGGAENGGSGRSSGSSGDIAKAGKDVGNDGGGGWGLPPAGAGAAVGSEADSSGVAAFASPASGRQSPAAGAVALTPCVTEPPAQLHASRSVRRKQAIASSGNGNTGGAVDDPLVAPLINMPAVSAAAAAARTDSALGTRPLFERRPSASGVGSAADAHSRPVAEAMEVTSAAVSEAAPVVAAAAGLAAGPVAEATETPPTAEPLLPAAIAADDAAADGRPALPPGTVSINIATPPPPPCVASAAIDESTTAAAIAAGSTALSPLSAAAGTGPVAMTVDDLRGRAPTYWGLLFDLPWEVVPFTLGMFVLVEGLSVQVRGERGGGRDLQLALTAAAVRVTQPHHIHQHHARPACLLVHSIHAHTHAGRTIAPLFP